MREFGIASIVLLLALTSFSGPQKRTGDSVEETLTVDAVDQLPIDEKLRVLTYNAFLRPPPIGWGDKTACRTAGIVERLTDEPIPRDIIAFNETFAAERLAQLAEGLEERFPHQILGMPKASGFRTNGGLSFVSRYPIEHWDARTFNHCSGDFNDCLATKGFLWAVVRVSENLKVNVLTTHMNSGGDDSARQTRRSQLSQIKQFIGSQPLFERWPTIMMGDLNVDGLRWTPRHPQTDELTEYAESMALLGNTCAGCETAACFAGCHPYPVDTFRRYAGKWSFDAIGTRQASTYICSSQSIAPCSDLNTSANWSERMRLDYVLHFGPPELVPDMDLRVVNSSSLDFQSDACGTSYLSDHRGVEATIEIRRMPAFKVELIGHEPAR